MASDSTEASSPTNRFRGLRALDDAIFAVEQTIMAAALSAMAVMVFLDVVFRRLVAQDSKVGYVITKLSGISDEATKEWIDSHVAPWVGLVVGVVLLWFAVWTSLRNASLSRNGSETAEALKRRAAMFAAMIAAGLVGLGYAMTSMGSGDVYLLGFAAVAALLSKRWFRIKPKHWPIRVAGLWLIGVPFFVWVRGELPQGYTWSQEVSLLLILWVGFLGASVCAHEGKHLKIEAAAKVIPTKLEPYIRAAGFVAGAVFCAFMAVLGWRYCEGQYEFDTPFGEQLDIPGWVAMAVVPAAFTLTALRFVAGAISALTGGHYGVGKDEDLEEARQAMGADDSRQEPKS